eukprot:709526-Amphidinium_carterae.1
MAVLYALQRSIGENATELRDVEWLASTAETPFVVWNATRVMSTLGWSGGSRDTEPFAGFRAQRKGVWKKWCDSLEWSLHANFIQSRKSATEKLRGKSSGASSTEVPEELFLPEAP